MTVKDYQNLVKLVTQIEQEYADKYVEAGKSHNHHEKKYNFYAVSVIREVKKRIREHYSGRIQ
ncbi:hypothetical protein CMO96_00225 [Candidatus Woesebacteria bacterium]|nr:hypothetical protein [Candidatus Woesebacteria bacterium]